MFDFSSFIIPAVGTVTDAPQPRKRKGREEGDYRFKITAVKKDIIHWKDGNQTPKIVLTLDVDGVKVDYIDLVLSTWGKYLEKLYAFAKSIGMSTDHDLKIDWDGLVGREGYAHIIPKKGQYRMLYNVDQWLEPKEEQTEYDDIETYDSLNNDDDDDFL